MESSSNPIQRNLSFALASAYRRVNIILNQRVKKHNSQFEAWRVFQSYKSDQHLTMGKLAEIVLFESVCADKAP